jgi:heme O synthase-like polyprenyltransferase
MLIPVFNFSYSIVSVVVMLLLGVWLMIDSRKILSGYLEKMSFRRAFVRINLYVLAVVIILSIDKLFL